MGGFYLRKAAGADALDRAQELLERATRLKTFHPEQLYLDLGELYQQKGIYSKAITALQDSIRADPRDERPYYILVKVYRRMGNAQAAAAAEKRFRHVSDLHVQMTALEARLSHDSTDDPSRLSLARIYRELGLQRKAADQYVVYLRRNPQAADIVNEYRGLLAEALPADRHEMVPSALK